MAKRFQISISNILLTCVIVGLALGWWIDRNNVNSDMVRLRLEYSVGQKDYSRRLSAIKELGQVGNKDSIPALLYAMTDPDFRCCEAASQSLLSITNQSFRVPCKVEPQRDPVVLSDHEQKELREMFQHERTAWINWLEQFHPEVELDFDPYGAAANNIDLPITW